MEYYAGIDVSLKESSVCVEDAVGKVVRSAGATSARRSERLWLCLVGPFSLLLFLQHDGELIATRP